MTVSGGQRWAAPVAETTAASVRQAPTAVVFPPLSWWFVVWRARVHEASTGNVEAGLSAIAEAMERSETIAGVPGLHQTGPASVSFEFWFEARTEREAAGGARIALRQACRAAGVGDPTLPAGGSRMEVMLMFEEVPTTLRRDDS